MVYGYIDIKVINLDGLWAVVGNNFLLFITRWRYEQAALQDCSKLVNRCRRLVYTDLLAAVNYSK